MFVSRKACYCAFCKVERKVYVSKHLGLLDVVGLVFLGVIMTYATFKSLDPRGLFAVGSLILIGEIFMQMKWRTSMICRNCGFDPVLYVRSPKDAGLKIKAFLEKRADSPAHLLRAPVILPHKKDTKGKNLSLKL